MFAFGDLLAMSETNQNYIMEIPDGKYVQCKFNTGKIKWVKAKYYDKEGYMLSADLKRAWLIPGLFDIPLKKGVSGTAVVNLNSDVDSFGSNVDNIIRILQGQWGLKPVDGIVGKDTGNLIINFMKGYFNIEEIVP